MSIARYYTIGAVVRDLRALKELDERLEELGVIAGSLVLLVRRRDERLVSVTLPEARTRKVESGLSRMQWFEFASTFLGVTAVSVLMGAVHLATGLIVQAIMTVAAAVGLVLYHRQPRLEQKLLGMGLPENFAEEWAEAFPDGFALALVTVPAELFDGAQGAFLHEGLETPLALARRMVI
jgi:Fe2+ transport system protein FeoA